MTNPTRPDLPLNDSFETFKGSGKFDAKGREIGFTVGFRDNGVDFYAWVQASRRVVKTHNFDDFGPRQHSRHFTSNLAATGWAWKTANERIAKVVAK